MLLRRHLGGFGLDRASRRATPFWSRRENLGRLNTARYSSKMSSETHSSTARKATSLNYLGLGAVWPEGRRDDHVGIDDDPAAAHLTDCLIFLSRASTTGPQGA